MTVLIQPLDTPNRVGVMQTYDPSIFGHCLKLVSGCCGEGVIWDQLHSPAMKPLWMCSECGARVNNGARRSAEKLNELTTKVFLANWISEATGIARELLTVEIYWS